MMTLPLVDSAPGHQNQLMPCLCGAFLLEVVDGFYTLL
jgi:hypothetical protein